MKFKLYNFTTVILIIQLNCHCEEVMEDESDGTNESQDKLQRNKRGINIIPTLPSGKKAPRSCSQYGLLGIRENGYCTLYDSTLNKFTAYCDFTSEPGYAWTLVTSFSRILVREEMNKKFQRQSFAVNAPVNDQTPNWVAFRYSKQKMESIKQFATHTRFTCSEDGPFLDLKNYNDYVRVKLSKLDPLTFSADRGRCIRTEFANIRNVSCSDCTLSFVQLINVKALHIDPWSSQDKCSFLGVARTAIPREKDFGYYLHYNTNFTCTKHSWSTTQMWFGSALLPATLSKLS